MSDKKTEGFDIGSQTWKSPKGSNIRNGDLEQWGNIDPCHRYLSDKLQAANKKLEFLIKCEFNRVCFSLGDYYCQGCKNKQLVDNEFSGGDE